jgi:hypothetical protein
MCVFVCLFSLLIWKGGLPYGNHCSPQDGVLREMREDPGDKRPPTGYPEKWTPIRAGNLSGVWNEDRSFRVSQSLTVSV